MFVCEDCLKERGTTSSKTFRSYGRCEVCGKTKQCLEISNNLKVNRKTDP